MCNILGICNSHSVFMITRFITFSLFTQVRCKFWTRVQRNIAGSREKSRILTKRSLYRHFYPQCRYEPMPRIRRNDNARLLYIRRIFLIYDKINIFLYIIDHSKLLHFIKNY